MNDTETTCHCGAEYGGSDHCPACGCEQYESYACEADDAPDMGVTASTLTCPYGQDGERVCCGNPGACTGPMRGRVFLDEAVAV